MMIELGMIRDLVAIFGVIAGFTYYFLTVRAATKTRKIQQVSRIKEMMFSSELSKISIELMDMDWVDLEDFDRKYDSTVNPDNYVKRWQFWGVFQELGYLMHEGLVDVETVYGMMGSHNLMLPWLKFKPIILAQREKYRDPDWFRSFEYFGEQLMQYRVKIGLPVEIHDADGYIRTT